MLYQVVMNEEEQYSVWGLQKNLPIGWLALGYVGSREECLDIIADIWKDVTPKSVRRGMCQ